MPCSPLDTTLPLPSGPSGNPLAGFGLPFALQIPSISPFPSGFPEDLEDLFNDLQLLIPPGALRATLNPNFGKDVFDALLKLLDQFYPFLMVFKFFLPLLNMILCILEVLCSLSNPFKCAAAISRLFSHCIPDFLNLFPFLALIAAIISLLRLLLALIEYILSQMLKLIDALLRNLNALIKSFEDADSNSVLAIAHKIGALLCIFQNLFVLLSLFDVIFEIVRDLVGRSFAVPPCDDSAGSPFGINGCCTTDVCPAIIKDGPYTRNTGLFQYLGAVDFQSSFNIPGFGNFTSPLRSESWQFFDPSQTIPQEFINIVDGYDVTVTPKPIFYPTDATYSASTQPSQAPYILNLRLFYNPITFGRLGVPRYIRINNCIITKPPTRNLLAYNNTNITFNTGVVILAGGQGYEDDGYTVLTGFASDGITPIATQATIENLIHTATKFFQTNSLSSFPVDGYEFQQVEYTFTPNFNVLFSKQLITLGCLPSVSFAKTFTNTVFAGNVNVQLGELQALFGGNTFPSPNDAITCMSLALAALRTNLTPTGVANFQATTTACLTNLQNNTTNAINTMIGIGFDPCSSSFSLTPSLQFTSKPITVSVSLNERNSINLATNLPEQVAIDLSSRIKAHPSFGAITPFTYDGYQSFNALLSSPFPGSGDITISFDNNVFCTNTIPTDPSQNPTHTLQTLSYQFVYTPAGLTTGTGDSDGAPRRDAGDLAREGNDTGTGGN